MSFFYFIFATVYVCVAKTIAFGDIILVIFLLYDTQHYLFIHLARLLLIVYYQSILALPQKLIETIFRLICLFTFTTHLI